VSKGPIVTGIGNAAEVRELFNLDADAGKCWRCACGALASGESCLQGHPAPWVMQAKPRRCLDCALPVEGTRLRCEAHRQAAIRENLRRYREQKFGAARQSRADGRRFQPARRYLKTFARKKRQQSSGTNGYRTREGYLAYQTAYNARRAESKRITERERYWRKKSAA
jgi:hypothetical protein